MNNLKNILNKKNITPYKLAKISKLGQATINEIYHDKREPKISTAMKISKALNVSIEDIFGGNNE